MLGWFLLMGFLLKRVRSLVFQMFHLGLDVIFIRCLNSLLFPLLLCGSNLNLLVVAVKGLLLFVFLLDSEDNFGRVGL